MYILVPSAGSDTRGGTRRFHVPISLTEQCNRHTVHYSPVGKRSMLCAPGLRGTLAVIMVLSVRLSHTALSCRGHSSLIDSSERHLGIRSLLFGNTVLYENNIRLSCLTCTLYDSTCLKSLRFGLRGSGGKTGLRSTSLCIFLCVCSRQSSIYSI